MKRLNLLYDRSLEDIMAKNKVTIKDVAKAAGVSTATVSYVINNRTDIKLTDERKSYRSSIFWITLQIRLPRHLPQTVRACLPSPSPLPILY